MKLLTETCSSEGHWGACFCLQWVVFSLGSCWPWVYAYFYNNTVILYFSVCFCSQISAFYKHMTYIGLGFIPMTSF